MQRRVLWAWAFYDWANSAWATAVLSGFFPMLLRLFWRDGLSSPATTLVLGLTNGLASLLVATMAAGLGAWADRHGARRRGLLVAAGGGIAGTLALACVPAGHWPAACMAFVLAAVGFSLGNLFYDALLVHVAPRDQLERASSLGYGLGYLGGGLFFAGAAWFVAHAGDAGQTPVAAMRLMVAASALWWAVFTLPLACWVPEPPAGSMQVRAQAIWKNMRAFPAAIWFLAGYFCYMDGLGAVIRMASDFGLSVGLAPAQMILALLLVQFVAWPAAVISGRLAGRLGALRVLRMELVVLAGACWAAPAMHAPRGFFVLAAVIGSVMGGIQALSRAIFAHLVPEGESGGWFGFFNIFGKFASVLGPIWAGGAAWLFGDPRMSAPATSVLVLAGLVLLERARARGI